MISVIIPTYNEAAIIAQTIAQTVAAARSPIEILVVDGGSVDQTIAIAEACHHHCHHHCHYQVITTATGRAAQMNAGAEVAQGDLLIFLHADTQLPDGFDQAVRTTLEREHVIAGAFNLEIAGASWGLRWVEWGVKWRSHLCQLPYGDQALFVKAKTFQQIGGFPDLPIMEDFVWVRQVKRIGKITIVPMSVKTSARRWQKLGIWRTTAINQIIILGYFLGISPEQLRRWYRSANR
jgi:rSAM/selenodomain-associated transferase 2